jgi:hypothetical protein
LATKAINTVRLLAWAVRWVRSTLRRLVSVAVASSRVLTEGGYPQPLLSTR